LGSVVLYYLIRQLELQLYHIQAADSTHMNGKKCVARCGFRAAGTARCGRLAHGG